MDYLHLLSLWLSGISVVFSFNFILAYLRSSTQTFSFKLTVYLVSADLLFAAAKLMSLANEGSVVCLAQAFVINFSQFASVFWSLLICFTLKRSLIEQEHSLEEKEKMFLLLGFGIPFIFSLM